MNADPSLAASSLGKPSATGSSGLQSQAQNQNQGQDQQQTSQNQQQQPQQHRSEQDFLNAYIYDYLRKHNLHQSANVFGQEADVKVHPVLKGQPLSQPARPADSGDEPKNEKRANGDSKPAENEDENSNAPNTLAKSVGIIDAPEGFLFEWWLIFWDLLFARSNKPASLPAQQFISAQV